MKKLLILLFGILIIAACKSDPKPKEISSDEVEDFMKNVFGEEDSASFDCGALLANVELSRLCIAKQGDYKITKDVENPLICIHILKSDKSTVDIAINTSPISLVTAQVYKAAKSDAAKKGEVKKIKNIGKAAFYHEGEYKAGDYAIMNRDLVFYEGKTMFTLHTSMGSRSKENCMSNEVQLKKLAKALLKSKRK